MILLKNIGRWSARLLRLSCMAGAFALTPGAGWSQGPPARKDVAADKLPPVHYSNFAAFHLPVQMSPALRAETREVCLYVKTPGTDWMRQDSAPATANKFVAKMASDGEYWFKLVTVSKSGKSAPADLSASAPDLRVIIDTTAPAIDVQPAATPGGDFCLRCSVADAHFDPTSLRVVCRTDRGERPLEPAPGMSGGFIVPKDLWAFPVRVSAADRAKNVGTKDVNVGEMVLATARAGGAESPAPIKLPSTLRPLPDPATTSGKVEAPPFVLPSGAGAVTLPPAGSLPPVITSDSRSLPPPIVTGDAKTLLPPTTDHLPSAPAGLEFPTPPSGGLPPVLGAPPGVAPGSLPGGGPPRRIISTTHATIEYRIDHVGPSGVGKIDVYLTADNGNTWKKAGEDPDRRSPAELDLPGEGLYGVRFVITNGNGFGGNPPLRGEPPTCWIEVDTTNPFVQLRPIEPVAQNGMLELHWTANDANLAAEPISLYFRTRMDGPWHVIGRGLKNDGAYRWAFPRDMGGQFWIKAEAIDVAGNVSRSETPAPLVLDMSEPRAEVLGISSTGARATPPVGH